MSSRRIAATAVSADLLADEDIRDIPRRSVVDLAAASVTNGDTVGLRLGRTIILDTGECNIEASADVIDLSRDGLVTATVVGIGKLRMPIGAVTTEIQAWVQVRPLSLG